MTDPVSFVAAPLIAGIVAFLVQLGELYFTKYPNTIELFIKKTSKIYAYSFMYGIAGVVLMLIMLFFVDVQVLATDTPFSNIYIQAVLVGLTVKGLLEINFFSFRVGSQSVPAGLKTLTQIFDPYFSKQLDLEEYNYSKEYVDQRAAKYQELDKIQKSIKDNAHAGLNDQDFQVFLIDLSRNETPSEALRFYLERFGKKNFDRVFP
jgi:hypothetical protein